VKIPSLPQAQRLFTQPIKPHLGDKFKAAIEVFTSSPVNKELNTIENAPVIAVDDPFKGRKLNHDDLPHYFGMGLYGLSSSAIEMNKPFTERTYRYGEFTDPDDINAFLDQLDRLDGEHRRMFQHIKPTQELLDLAQKMSDEELSLFAEFAVTTSSLRFGMQNKDISEQLISSLSKLSDEALSSTVNTMAAILKQGDDYKKPTSPIGDDINGNELLVMQSSDENIDWFKSSYKANNTKTDLAISYANLLMNKNQSDEQLTQLNSHLADTNLQQSSGIMDMMSLIKTHQNDEMLAMLSEVDKDNQNDVFTYLAQQTNYQANKQYYQIGNGKHVAQQDNISDPSSRRILYDNILEAYNDIGLGWINDTLDEIKESPAQIQNQIWEKLLADKEKSPDQFIHSDSVQKWVTTNVPSMQMNFHTQQINKIYDYNSERLVPDLLGRLTFFSSGNSAHSSTKNDVSYIKEPAVT